MTRTHSGFPLLLLLMTIVAATMIAPASAAVHLTGGSALESEYGPTTDGIQSAFLLAFLACNTAATDCRDPRNHLVFLAQSDDGVHWSLVPNWQPHSGSVPDVIRRGDALYIYTGGWVRRYRFSTQTWEDPAPVTLIDPDADSGMFADPSLIVDEQGRLVMFYLLARKNQDPARCAPGETSCVKTFHSAIEVEGSDGAEFVAEPGHRLQITIDSSGSASDPDIFYDGSRYVLYISRGNNIQVYTGETLHGSYALLDSLPDGFLTHGPGGTPAGHFDPTTARYWTFAPARGSISRAEHASLNTFLNENDFVTILEPGDIGLAPSYILGSPGFALNTPGPAPTATASPTPAASSTPTVTPTPAPTSTATPTAGDIISHTIWPRQTDPAIDDWLEPHYLYLDPDRSLGDTLFVHLPGSFGKPVNYQLILQEVARADVPAIGLRYPNRWTVAGLCRNDPDPDCHEHVRAEILDGVDRTALVNISPANSLQNRLAKLLQYLNGRFPDAGWDRFLDGDAPRWSKIIVSGHSQGGGHAAFIAKEHEVRRVMMFGSPADNRDDKPAAWLLKPHQTPSNRYYGFNHKRERGANQQYLAWGLLGLNAFGPVVLVDEVSPPYRGSHQLTTDALPRTGDYADAHGSTVVDRKTPHLADGSPLFAPVWRAMCCGAPQSLFLPQIRK